MNCWHVDIFIELTYTDAAESWEEKKKIMKNTSNLKVNNNNDHYVATSILVPFNIYI